METKFQKWLLEHDPSGKYIYKNAWWDQYIFWRDKIIPIFFAKKFGHENWNEIYSYVDSFTEVIGEHYSKSLKHPVLKISYNNVTFVFRYNFYDYDLVVVGDIPFWLPDKFLNHDKIAFYQEGIPKEYSIKIPFSRENNKTFALTICDRYDFYTVLLLLKEQIDKARQMIMIRNILTENEPPYKHNDLYFERKPWKKFGGVSSGICMKWCWYSERIILKNTTLEEVETAWEEMQQYKK